MMTNSISIAISGLALAVAVLAFGLSAITAWVTLFRKGTVKMTQPTVIFFGPDGRGSNMKDVSAKIFLRTLLFATSKRGRVIESMHITLSHNEAWQNFNIWVYGEKLLVRGSGLFVGESGLAANHHFLAPKNATSFRFNEGMYQLRVFAHLLGDKERLLLFSQDLEISKEHALALADPEAGLYFDWGPDTSRYFSHIDKRPPPSLPDGLLPLLEG
jgi:hypothetical protein